MSDIVISEFMDQAAIDAILRGRDVLYDPKLVDDKDRLYAALADCRALIVRNRTQVRAPLLDAAPRLKVVGRLGVGLDNIDVDACAAHKIIVRPASGANDLSVAEYVITAALLLRRRAWYATSRLAAGEWPRMELIGGELSGARLGLIGFGAIARLTATKAAALGMTVAAFDPFLPPDHAAWLNVARQSFEEILSSCDVVSLHTPLTPQTRRMLDGAALRRMRSGAILINAARGGIVDESALAAALSGGHLGGAALDVFETEPLTPAAAAVFKGIPNLILTPHIAGVTEESNVRVSDVTARAVIAALDA
ncbi:MAG TPA: hydroxyacid dehydrogenase [Steroidobacteraceae bacterium]|jgi:(S)-sulfolactate dehydrogenase|nr:hydroxyacid dehydrogenase [Steroidobacteraceae bacterium]